jgi:hypothetical protein
MNLHQSPVRLAIKVVATFLLLSTFPSLDSRCFGDEPASGELRYWKGNIHTHSLWSDGDDFPEMIAEWYRTHDYNFLALSDHNVLSQGQRWMNARKIQQRGGKDVLPKYLERFGSHWVESRGDKASDKYEIRLKPLDEFRHLVEERGKFMMVQGEEISDRSQGGPVHMNATNIGQVIQPLGGKTVREAMANNLRAVEQQSKKLGREILVHLNHPNFGYAVTAEDLASVIQERFFEVYNGHPAIGHFGDDNHPGVERLWDIANTIRIDKLKSPPLFGVATDDSHAYHGKPNGSSPGRGWVMVRSRFLTPDHIVRAMRKGDFYASSGVVLRSVVSSDEQLKVEIEAGNSDEEFTTQFIGTRVGYDDKSEPRMTDGKENSRITRKYSNEVGAVLATVKGSSATYRFSGKELYVRAVITSNREMVNPSPAGQLQQAWTQPVVPRGEESQKRQ